MRRRLGAGVPLVYAADWTEYGAHVRDGGATIRFPLDDLFADANIAAVGIDWYPPFTDWRDGPGHADLALAGDIHDRAYLKAAGASGEAFDWYYPDATARAAQDRHPITDGASGKPWIYRPKDLVGWWSNRHVERDGGVETRATAWVPAGKPIWLTEVGVPAVDKGTNGPNVFPDPKSAENAVPPFSRGVRDDLIQLRGLEAVLTRFDPAAPGFTAADNPVSPVYGGRMVDPAGIFVWCWDARPFPVFSDMTATWADAPQWGLGHWITGRIEGCDLDLLIARILAEFGFDAPSRWRRRPSATATPSTGRSPRGVPSNPWRRSSASTCRPRAAPCACAAPVATRPSPWPNPTSCGPRRRRRSCAGSAPRRARCPSASPSPSPMRRASITAGPAPPRPGPWAGGAGRPSSTPPSSPAGRWAIPSRRNGSTG